VIHATVFGKNSGRGNPAAIVLDVGELSASAMQSIATGERVETTFVLPPAAPAHPWRMRFFLPQGEMAMCVHGALGAVAALVARDPFMPARMAVQTDVGKLELDWRHAQNGIFATIDQLAAHFGPPIDSAEKILDAIGIDESALDPVAGPVQVVSVSRAKLLVPVIDADMLDTLSPTIGKLNAVCEEFGATGIYAFTRHPRDNDRAIDARQFSTGPEYREDPATGVAAAALAGYLLHHGSHTQVRQNGEGSVTIRIGQGDAIGCPCIIEATATERDGIIQKTRVAGFANVALRRGQPLT
jgi:trans-2,3-dihydro-3-hydroxyanthranilate isomerase